MPKFENGVLKLLNYEISQSLKIPNFQQTSVIQSNDTFKHTLSQSGKLTMETNKYVQHFILCLHCVYIYICIYILSLQYLHHSTCILNNNSLTITQLIT